MENIGPIQPEREPTNPDATNSEATRGDAGDKPTHDPNYGDYSDLDITILPLFPPRKF